MILHPLSRLIFVILVAAILSGCAQQPVNPSQDAATGSFSVFSASPAGGLPKGWEPLVINRTKKATEYKLVREHHRTILHARAASASSGLMQHVKIDPLAQPWLNWHWRIGNVISSADNFLREAEDSPVRIVLGFDGDKDSLAFADKMLFETVKVLTGQELPYATLMYVWENKAPIGTVIASTRTGRVKMIVAASGADGIGQWHDITRNIVEDFEKAYGEKPGRLIGVGVLSDTDNTGESVEAWYGDIRFMDTLPMPSLTSSEDSVLRTLGTTPLGR